ncbi:MAG: site-2 protease family protein [Planctomycetota bacterium]
MNDVQPDNSMNSPRDGSSGIPTSNNTDSPTRYNPLPPTRKRRLWLPIFLFIATCFSTFWVGAALWSPNFFLEVGDMINNGSLLRFRRMVLANWDSGLTYMVAVMLILFLHEMGHFVATIIYRVPASFPYFLPFPANPIGTLGAVIVMQGNEADRKEIFDIGIAGPLAGLFAAVPIAYFGVSQLDLTIQPSGGFGFRLPWLMDWFAQLTHVPGYQTGDVVWLNQLNPLFVAGWVGLLITGVNMMPIGQLDGGHITYTLFGRAAHTIAQLTIVFAIAYMVYHLNFMLVLMVVLLLLMGPNHPPTRNDRVPIGPFRYGLGLLSLSIPFLCFPPQVFKINF